MYLYHSGPGPQCKDEGQNLLLLLGIGGAIMMENIPKFPRQRPEIGCAAYNIRSEEIMRTVKSPHRCLQY